MESLHAWPAIQWWQAGPCSHRFDSYLCTQVSTLFLPAYRSKYNVSLWLDHKPTTPRINRGDCLFTRKWKLTVDPLWGNHRSPRDQQRRSPLHAKVKVDCWSSLRQSSTPSPHGWTEVIAFACESESSLLILSEAIVDDPPPPARINRGDRLCTRKWKLTVDPLRGDRQDRCSTDVLYLSV